MTVYNIIPILVPWRNKRTLGLVATLSSRLRLFRNSEVHPLGTMVQQKGGNCLISYRAGAWHYRIFPDFLKSPVSKWRIVGVKTRTKAFFFEEILINIPSENLPKLSKGRMQYFCHALKLNLRSRHSAARASIVRWTGRSHQRWL